MAQHLMYQWRPILLPDWW